MADINGIAHTVLSVTDVGRARRFYEPLLSRFGMKKVADSETGFYFVGARTAVAIMLAAEQHRQERFDQTRVGLHHLCFRAKNRETVDEVAAFLKERGDTLVHDAEEGAWAPGYYSVLFEDPDGIRLEVNFVPGKGLLAEGTKFVPDGYDWQAV